ncbi:MAG: adenylate/guanylate cyclase domain-containing protein [Rhodospirillales bacterium]|nr:adenylate/guanylate cyclase domain-containing protein [Rhodospirillales bacterium]HIJ45128.1 hypothetical protein [Rhodospirillaceae bacterium]
MASREITYEVHVRQKGRWEIHARHSGQKQDAATHEAKVLDQLASVEAVKVIKESYEIETGLCQEIVVYQSPGPKSSSPGKGGGRAEPGPPSAAGGSSARRKAPRTGAAALEDTEGSRPSPSRKMKKSKKDTFSAVLVKVLFIILISVIVATVTTALAFPFISDSTLFGMHSSTNIRTLVLLSIFLFVFLAIATPMVRSLMAKTHLESAGHEGQAAPGWSMLQSAARSTRPRPSPKRHGGGVKAKTSGKADAAAAASQKALKESRENGKKKETPGEQKPEPSKEDKNATARQGDVLEAENDTKPRADESEKPEKDKSKDADRLSSYAERQKTVMVKFLGQTLQQIQDDNKNMDSFNKFGVNLLLSGACDILGHKRRLDPRSASKILSAGVQIMGFNKSNAESFAAKYEEYLLSDARYMQMFQAGRNAMNTFLTDEVAATKHMKMALEEWNKPKPKEETTGPITVMFTDMVGSTALTQSMGDAVAQQVVRRVVRDALTQFGGREIKHTGDGIMASFPTTSNGVEAAKIMQTNVAVHNKGNPDLPLHIKIGINAGEPIAEDNDLFGTTVQLAARIVDKAKTEQIFVSEIVRGICAGKDLEFVDRGGYAMKGFENELTLYEVVWNEDAGGEEEIDTNKAS